ncbi:MAG: heavy-metal-associated domain-containing protein [Clostridiales bacterium]|nr:heavy-metal-associated domain-containing protein [Clostridiales bacterium]
MTNKTYQLESLACPTCVAKISNMLKKTKGITYSEVLFNSSRAKVTFDEEVISSQDIIDKIEKFGYKVLSEK